MKTAAHVFKTFPEFSELTYLDREKYEELIADYPPLADISFAVLMTWWSALDNCRIAQLDGNLVICYWMPHDEEASGLCVIGTHKVDATICTIFDYLQEKGEKPRLVHVPEFVVSSLEYPEMFQFTGERKHDECVLPVGKLAKVSEMPRQKRWKIRSFLKALDGKKVSFKSLDLSQRENQQFLFDLHNEWKYRGPMNNMGKYEEDFMYEAIPNTDRLGYENVCLYIGENIHSFLLYQLPDTPGYAIANLVRFSYARPFLFEFCAYQYAKWFAEQGIKYINIDSDQDQKTLRVVKLSLGPLNYFRKYTIEPRQ